MMWKNQQVIDFCWDVLGLRKGMTLLDLGCGDGRIVIAAAKKFAETMVTDLLEGF